MHTKRRCWASVSQASARGVAEGRQERRRGPVKSGEGLRGEEEEGEEEEEEEEEMMSLGVRRVGQLSTWGQRRRLSPRELDRLL
jgi:hypothetical protein